MKYGYGSVNGYGWMGEFEVWLEGWVRHGNMGNKEGMMI